MERVPTRWDAELQQRRRLALVLAADWGLRLPAPDAEDVEDVVEEEPGDSAR